MSLALANIPLQADAIHISCLCFGRGKAFAIMSAVCSWSRLLSTAIEFAFIVLVSLIECHLMSMCFDLGHLPARLGCYPIFEGVSDRFPSKLRQLLTRLYWLNY